MKKLIFFLFLISTSIYAKDIIPIGNDNNTFYYRVGGGSDFVLPPVSDTTTIHLKSTSDLGMGNSCSAINPALSIRNSINDLKDSADNLEQSIIASATGSLIQFPMYLLAQANPTAYNLLNNALLSAHQQLAISIKSCETIKSQIANGQNPYQDWGMISINDQWKRHLSLVSSGNEDMNHTKKEIDINGGKDGLPWVQGKIDSDSSTHAGGKNQPPVHVIADTVKAGYNTLLNRDLRSEEDSPITISNTELRHYFQNPKAAVYWITNVLGDQIITTCTDENCKKQQGTLIGHGLLPWMTSSQDNNTDCIDKIRDNLTNLVSGSQALTKDNLLNVSANGLAISPDVIASIRGMDEIQQKLMINKTAQEISMQRVIDKALIARHILTAGAQVPVIAANHPAQVIIEHAIANLDNEIRSFLFESQIRKQVTTDTLSQTLNFKNLQQQNAMRTGTVSSPAYLMDNGAIRKESSS